MIPAIAKSNPLNQSTDKKLRKKTRRNRSPAKSVSELVGGILEPIIAKRAGMTLSLINAWSDIIGLPLGKHSRPEKILWPRRAHDDDPFQAATLVVACDGAQAIFFQHETDAIIERVNTFLGFAAIDRIKIQQKPVSDLPLEKEQAAKELTGEEKKRLDEILSNISDDKLRNKLAKLGEGIIMRQRANGQEEK